MAFNKRLTDLIDYTSVLPYASELFGIYNPLSAGNPKESPIAFTRDFKTINICYLTG